MSVRINVQCPQCKEWRTINKRSSKEMPRLCTACSRAKSEPDYRITCDVCGEDKQVSKNIYYKIRNGERVNVCKECYKPKYVRVKCQCGEERDMLAHKASRYKGTSCPKCKPVMPKPTKRLTLEEKGKLIKATEATRYRVDTDASFLQSKVHKTDEELDRKMIESWLEDNMPTKLGNSYNPDPYQTGLRMCINK